MKIGVEVKEGLELARQFAKAGEQATNAVERALVQGGLRVERDAKKIVPVDTGRLMNSISHRPEGAGGPNPTVLVGTNVEYAPYVEFGHGGRAIDVNPRSRATIYSRGAAARPYLYPALQQNKERIRADVIRAIREELGKR